MLVIFEQDEYKVVVEAESHEKAWEILWEYENQVIKDANELFANKPSFFGSTTPKPLYASIDDLKKEWRFEASTTGKVVEFEGGEIAYV